MEHLNSGGNLGVRTGQVEGKAIALLVLDVDKKGGDAASLAIEKLMLP